MAMMERAFSLFTPFYRGAETGEQPGPAQEIAELRAEVESLRRQLEETKAEAGSK
jgi:polyhydroxyalkanoate synthesis regulator protein